MIESPLNDTDNINSFLVSGLNTVNVKRQEAAGRPQDLPLVIQLPDQKNHISHQESKIFLLGSVVDRHQYGPEFVPTTTCSCCC